MPELPEVETLRRDLDKTVIGKRIKSVEVTGMRSIRRHPNKRHFASKLEGAKLTGVRRRGKYLVFDLDTEEVLVVHLRMSGQLIRAANKDPVAKHTHVVFQFTQHGQLRFVDPRTFGEMFVTGPDELEDLAELGVDPIDKPMSWTEFGEIVLSHKMKLKALLMDQKIIAGLGNIYSDEILFTAGLRYDRLSHTLSTQEIRRLYRGLLEVLHEAIKHRGSTLSDEQYVDLNGKPGEYQELHQVYDREGQACRRCRAPVVKEKFQGRSTFFCAQCQV